LARTQAKVETKLDIQTSRGKGSSKPRKFFFVGPSGSGKTTLAGYFPNPYFVDSEEGVDSIPFPVRFSRIKTWDNIFSVFTQIEKVDCETIVINDATTMAIILQREVAKAEGRLAPELQDRGVAAEHLRTILYQLFQEPFAGKNIIIICQASMQKDELSQMVFWDAVLPGQMASEIPPFCDEVWRFEAKTAGTSSEVKYYVHTAPNPQWPRIKSRKGVKTGQEVTGEANIKAFLKEVL
jgi:hypothetical protein